MNNKVLDKAVSKACEDSPIIEAKQIMEKLDVGSIAITDKEGSLVVGTLTESDINGKLAVKGNDNSTILTSEIMDRRNQIEKPGTEEVIESMTNKGNIDL
jgi:predicted transcriptional regulator